MNWERDFRETALPENRYAPIWRGDQLAPDWRAALQYQFGAFVPVDVSLGYLTMRFLQESDPGGLTKAASLIGFPSDDLLPRLNPKHPEFVDCVSNFLRRIQSALEADDCKAVGYPIEAGPSGLRLSELGHELTAVAWRDLRICAEQAEGTSYGAFLRADWIVGWKGNSPPWLIEDAAPAYHCIGLSLDWVASAGALPPVGDFGNASHEAPAGYLPISSAWKLFAEAHSRLWLPDVFDPLAYRPDPQELSWDFVRDPVTWDIVKRINKPSDNALAYAASVPDQSSHSHWNRGFIQKDWEEWLISERNALVATSEGHRKVYGYEIEAMRPALWTTVEASDLSRTDYGPKRWLAPAIGEDFPAGVFVEEAALKLAIENIEQRLADRGLLAGMTAKKGSAISSEATPFLTSPGKENAPKPFLFSSEKSDIALRINAGLALQAPPKFAEFSDAVRLIRSRSRLSEVQIITKFLSLLRTGELCAQGVPVKNIFEMVANPQPEHEPITEGEWRDMKLAHLELPVRGWVATGIYHPGGMPIGAMGLVLKHEKTRPRYSRLIIEAEVIGRFVSEFPKVLDVPASFVESGLNVHDLSLQVSPVPSNAGVPKQLRPSKTTTVDIVAQLLQELFQDGAASNTAKMQKIISVARQRGLLAQNETISVRTLQRAKKLIH